MLRFVVQPPTTLQCKSVVVIVTSRPSRVNRKPIVFLVFLLIKLNELLVLMTVDSLCSLILEVTLACYKQCGAT